MFHFGFAFELKLQLGLSQSFDRAGVATVSPDPVPVRMLPKISLEDVVPRPVQEIHRAHLSRTER